MNGQSSLAIGLTMFLRDQFSGPAGRIRTSSQYLIEDLRKVQAEALREQRNLNAGVATAGIAAVSGLARMIDKASQFGYEMQYVKTITEATAAEAKSLNSLAIELGQNTMFTGRQVAEGMRFMAMAGMSAKEVKENIAAAVYLAGSSKSRLEGRGGAADIMTNVMKQYGVQTKYSMQVADILSYGANKANTDVFELGEAIKYAGSTAMDLNVSLQESVALLMALSNAGLQGSMAGVAMENSLRYVAAAVGDFGSGRQKQALEMLGLSKQDLTDANGNLKSMVEVIRTIGNALDSTMGPGNNVDKQSALQAIFGVRGKRASSLLIRNLKEFDSFVTDVSVNSMGNSKRVTEGMMTSLQGSILQMASAWQNMWYTFAESSAPFLKWILNDLQRVFATIQKVLNTPILGNMLTAGLIGFTLMITAATAFRAVVAGIKLIYVQSQMSMSSYASSTVAGFGAMTASVNAYNVAMTAAQAKQMAAAGMIPGMAVNSRGRIINSTTRSFVSNAAAATAATAAARAMSRGGLVSMGASLKMVGGRLLGFMGGPWGIALTVGLPMIMGLLARVLSGNKEAVEKNTDALNEQSNTYRDSNMVYSTTFVPTRVLGPRLALQAALGGSKIPGEDLGPNFNSAIEGLLSKLTTTTAGGDIIINIDGNQVFRASRDSVKQDFRGIGVYQ